VKNERLTGIICRRYCAYYKEGKEGLLCGTYRYLAQRFSAEELESAPEKIVPDFSEDAFILEEICSACDFLVGGCDYRAGIAAPPCGGYRLVEWLRRQP